jgi:HPt (histidine-containing phosphotransfer) domain-containing protein
MENKNALVNLSSLRNLLGDSNESIKEILNLFIENIPPSIADIKGLLTNQDWDGLRKRIHSIKSYYGYVGNDDLNAKLSQWETDLSEAKAGIDHQGLMSELEDKSAATVIHIQEIIKNELGA